MKEGKLGQALEAVRTELVDLLSHLEASLDFAEEGIEPRVGPEFLARVETVREKIAQLLRTAPLGRILQEGALTVIVGEPNVGKSSLPQCAAARRPRHCRSNARHHARLDRSAVQRARPAAAAGRHRGTARLVRPGRDRRHAPRPARCCPTRSFASRRRGAPAVYPGKNEAAGNIPCLLIANKSDLGRHGTLPSEAIFLSAKKGEGLGDLEVKIESALLGKVTDETETVLTINARQNATLERAAQSLDRAREALRGSAGLELVSIELRDALHDLAEVIGETDNEDILTRLFQNFCIGK